MERQLLEGFKKSKSLMSVLLDNVKRLKATVIGGDHVAMLQIYNKI